jgi:hypothetical protein
VDADVMVVEEADDGGVQVNRRAGDDIPHVSDRYVDLVAGFTLDDE